MTKVSAELAAGAMLIGLSSAALAQPAIKPAVIDDDLREVMWCSAIFFEASLLYELDTPWAIYYDDISWALDDMMYAQLTSTGLTSDAVYELWAVFEDEAFMLPERMPAFFAEERDACVAEFGKMAEPPPQ